MGNRASANTLAHRFRVYAKMMRVVHVISKGRLRAFWEVHPQAEVPLAAWYKLVSKATWQHLMEVRSTFPTADAVEGFTVFNIGGNDFRLVVDIVYQSQTVFVKWVGTHADYSRDRWKK